MDWQEVNCLIEALESLITKYESELLRPDVDDDDLADLNNDLAYTEILLGNYKRKRDTMV